MTTVSAALAALNSVAPLEKRSAGKAALPEIPPLDPEHGPQCHTAFHAGFLEGVEAAQRWLGGDTAYSGDDDEDDNPDWSPEDDPEAGEDDWERGYNWSPPDDYDDSIDGIGERPSGVTDYCPCCGDPGDCDCGADCACGRFITASGSGRGGARQSTQVFASSVPVARHLSS